MTRAFLQILTAGGCLAACAIGPAVAADISGAGATFPFPIYAKWADAYKRATGVEVTYRPIGSGDGIRQIQAKEVTFGASDMPLNGADLELHGLVQFPTVVGGIVAVVNIEGVKTSELTLDGPTLARIFLGEIKSWNDGALRKLNPSVKLPSQAITVVRRSDGSGTLRLHGLPLQGERDLENPGRIDHLHRLAGRNRSRGQRGRCRHRCPHQGIDRICRIRLCYAEQAHRDQAR
jgi:phosphate transport system substrate-binding protein